MYKRFEGFQSDMRQKGSGFILVSGNHKNQG